MMSRIDVEEGWNIPQKFYFFKKEKKELGGKKRIGIGSSWSIGSMGTH